LLNGIILEGLDDDDKEKLNMKLTPEIVLKIFRRISDEDVILWDSVLFFKTGLDDMSSISSTTSSSKTIN
jgi:hypothetical protein